MLFSERYGHTPAKSIIQIDSVDDALKNSLWSILKLHIWDHVHFYQYATVFRANPEIETFCQRMWFNYYKLPLDTLENDWNWIYNFLRKDFFNCKWFELYNFLEFIADNFPYNDKESFITACNFSLEREISGYRFIDDQIAPITSSQEIAEIEAALVTKNDHVRTHLRRALELFSDRKQPDYRNSVKESISAVESLVQRLLGQKGTLGKLVKKLETELGLHPSLGKAFDSLYGYTSDENGIRHAILESAKVDFEDAKFFLVVCSAFVNFVTAKTKS
jgi:hypothetical protein